MLARLHTHGTSGSLARSARHGSCEVGPPEGKNMLIWQIPLAHAQLVVDGFEPSQGPFAEPVQDGTGELDTVLNFEMSLRHDGYDSIVLHSLEADTWVTNRYDRDE